MPVSYGQVVHFRYCWTSEGSLPNHYRKWRFWLSCMEDRMVACVYFHMYLGRTAGSAKWLTDFSHFLEGKVACVVASGDCSSETEDHMKSINPLLLLFTSSLKNAKWGLHIYNCSQHVTCALSLCITSVCASSLIKASVCDINVAQSMW